MSTASAGAIVVRHVALEVRKGKLGKAEGASPFDLGYSLRAAPFTFSALGREWGDSPRTGSEPAT